MQYPLFSNTVIHDIAGNPKGDVEVVDRIPKSDNVFNDAEGNYRGDVEVVESTPPIRVKVSTRPKEVIASTGSDRKNAAVGFAQQLLLCEPNAISVEINPEVRGDEEVAEKTAKKQLLKWIGNKQRFANEIVSYFPTDYTTYFEPFLGSGAVWSVLAPKRALVSDVFVPLIEIWQALQTDPEMLKRWYAERWNSITTGNRVEVYERVKASYNAHPNGADLLFLCRTCYGGVVRFRKSDGYMSTPCGVHKPMPPANFAKRVDAWQELTDGTTIACMDYAIAMRMAQAGDLVYCDPPYSFSQAILYGAQSFNLKSLFEEIKSCKMRGVRVVLSIDGTKKSGNMVCDIPIPEGLFEREILVSCGRSMLKRFQMDGKTLEQEVVADRLLLTF